MRSIRDSRLALEDETACLLTRDNLYPKLVLNRCGAISTDTMHRMKFRDGIDPELANIAHYNSIAFAFTELCGRSYGGGVLEILPKEVDNIHVLNTGLLNINAELKRNVINVIDGVVRNGAILTKRWITLMQRCSLVYLDSMKIPVAHVDAYGKHCKQGASAEAQDRQ